MAGSGFVAGRALVFKLRSTWTQSYAGVSTNQALAHGCCNTSCCFDSQCLLLPIKMASTGCTQRTQANNCIVPMRRSTSLHVMRSLDTLPQRVSQSRMDNVHLASASTTWQQRAVAGKPSRARQLQHIVTQSQAGWRHACGRHAEQAPCPAVLWARLHVQPEQTRHTNSAKRLCAASAVSALMQWVLHNARLTSQRSSWKKTGTAR